MFQIARFQYFNSSDATILSRSFLSFASLGKIFASDILFCFFGVAHLRLSAPRWHAMKMHLRRRECIASVAAGFFDSRAAAMNPPPRFADTGKAVRTGHSVAAVSGHRLPFALKSAEQSQSSGNRW